MKNIPKICFNLLNISLITTFLIVDICASSENKRKRENEVSVFETQQEIKNVDYLSSLPEELIMEIMGYLTFGDLGKLSQSSELFRQLFHGEIHTFLARFYNTKLSKAYVEITNSNVDDILKMMKLFNRESANKGTSRIFYFFKKPSGKVIKELELEKVIKELEFRIISKNQSTNADLNKNKILYTSNSNSWANFCMILLKEFLNKEEFTPKIKLLTSLKEDIYRTNVSLLKSNLEYYREFLSNSSKVIDQVSNKERSYKIGTVNVLEQIQPVLCKNSSDQSIIESLMKKHNIQGEILKDWYNGDDEWIKISNEFKNVAKEIIDLFNRKIDSTDEFPPVDSSAVRGKSKCLFTIDTIENKTSKVTSRIVRRLFQLKDE